jgi:hypothetical protein
MQAEEVNSEPREGSSMSLHTSPVCAIMHVIASTDQQQQLTAAKWKGKCETGCVHFFNAFSFRISIHCHRYVIIIEGILMRIFHKYH